MGYAEINEQSEALIDDVRKACAAEMGAHRDLLAKVHYRQVRVMRGLRIMGGSTFYFDKPLMLTILETVLSESVGYLML